MKKIIDLERSMNDPKFFEAQFKHNGTQKNILFVNPQRSGRHFYKMILPYIAMQSNEVKCAITSISKYDQKAQLIGGREIQFSDEPDLELRKKKETEMIKWSDSIIFPFTTQPLVLDIYANIRKVNPHCKIVYNVDFNFLALSKNNPYYEIFAEPSVRNAVEDNIYFSDLTLTSNPLFADYLVQYFQKLIPEKYSDIHDHKCFINTLFIMSDPEIMLENVDFNPDEPLSSKPPTAHTPEVVELLEKTSKSAEKIKKAAASKKTDKPSVKLKPKSNILIPKKQINNPKLVLKNKNNDRPKAKRK